MGELAGVTGVESRESRDWDWSGGVARRVGGPVWDPWE